MNYKITLPYSAIKSYINSGHQRSVKAKKNILASFLIKGGNIAISLLMVPLTIYYVNPSRYGIWLTISSIVGWFSFFDIGLSQGLRNKFAEAKAVGNDRLAQVYVSTTYAILALIFCAVWLIFLSVNHFLNWSYILSIPADMRSEVSVLAIIVFTYFCIQLVLKVVNTVLIANQQPANASFVDLLSQAGSLIFIFILVKTTQGSLIKLGIALCLSPILVLTVANLLLFRGIYKAYRPKISLVNFSYARQLFNLGFKFFVIQIASIIQYESTLFLIAHYFDTRQVTAYNIAYKYFFTLQMVFAILLSPLWTGVTDAFSSGEWSWVRNAVKKYLLVLIPFVATGLIMLLCSNFVYDLWIGKNVINIDFNISLLCYIFFATGMFASIFVFVINGTGALKLQFISSIITSIIFFSLALLLIKYFHLGVESILISAIISNLYGYIVAPLQYYQIFIRQSKSPIWYS